MAKRGTRGLVYSVERIEFHRNGISGASFYAVDFTAQAWTGEGIATLRGIVFQTPGHVAVIEPNEPETKWRGDNFEAELRAEIGKYEKAQNPEPVCGGHAVTGPRGKTVSVTIPGCDCRTNEERRGFLQVQTGRS